MLTDIKWAVEIFKGFEKYKIPWKMMAAAAFMLDDEMIELMRKSGCVYVDICSAYTKITGTSLYFNGIGVNRYKIY